jgi:hypothetical protein
LTLNAPNDTGAPSFSVLFFFSAKRASCKEIFIMGSRSVKAPEPTAATPIAAQAKTANTEDIDMAAADQVRRRKGISAMYNRFGAMSTGKDKLGV